MGSMLRGGGTAARLPDGRGSTLGRGRRLFTSRSRALDNSARCRPAGPGAPFGAKLPALPHFLGASQEVGTRVDWTGVPSGRGLGAAPEYGVARAGEGSFPGDPVWKGFC